MTEQTAQKVANVALGAAALGAAYVIARTPRLRRMALGLAFTALTGAHTGVALTRSAARVDSERTPDMIAGVKAQVTRRAPRLPRVLARVRVGDQADGAGHLARRRRRLRQ